MSHCDFLASPFIEHHPRPIFDRIVAQGVQFGSGPFNNADGELNHRRGGRGLYFSGGPDPHLYEIMTVAETGT